MAQRLINLPVNTRTRDTDPWSGRAPHAEEQLSLCAAAEAPMPGSLCSTTQVNTAMRSHAPQGRTDPLAAPRGSLQGRPAQPKIIEYLFNSK